MNNYEEYYWIECDACDGIGGRSIGDCEDGVWDTCPVCEGRGRVEK